MAAKDSDVKGREASGVRGPDVGPARKQLLHHLHRKVDIRLHGKGNSKIPWRKAGQPSHLVDLVDSDQWVVNKELSVSPPPSGPIGFNFSQHSPFRRKDSRKGVFAPGSRLALQCRGSPRRSDGGVRSLHNRL